MWPREAPLASRAPTVYKLEEGGRVTPSRRCSMPDREDVRPTALRPVELVRPSDVAEPTSRLRSALDVVDAKLNAAEGFDGIIGWVRQAERLVAATSDDEIERTRRGIRELIEKLLSLNADVQTIVRLKRLLR